MHAGRSRLAVQAGFTYLALLFALAVFGTGLAALGQAWSDCSRRDRERELLLTGRAYVRAIGSYFNASPGEKRYPMQLQDLLEDRRLVDARRHLRKLYHDPMSPAANWGLVRAADGGIMGIYSTSAQPSLRRQAIYLPGGAPISGERYLEWRFVYLASPAGAVPAAIAP